jgi:hypothetical protein
MTIGFSAGASHQGPKRPYFDFDRFAAPEGPLVHTGATPQRDLGLGGTALQRREYVSETKARLEPPRTTSIPLALATGSLRRPCYNAIALKLQDKAARNAP